jgi:hypothetical protein
MEQQRKSRRLNRKSCFALFIPQPLYRWYPKPKLILGITILVASGSGLVACERNFNDVQKLGDRGEVIRKSSLIIADDFYQSCLRRAKIPEQNLEAADYFGERRTDIENCQKNYLPAKEAIVNAYDVLAIYLDKLAAVASQEGGEISDKEVEKLNQALGNLATALGGISGLSIPSVVTNNLSQAGGFVRDIFNIIASQIRQDAIVPTVACTNDDIDGYTQGLEAITNQVYVNTLNSERQKIESYYTSLLPQNPPANATYHPLSYPSERLSAQELVKRYNEELDLIDKREIVAIEFASFLQKTRETHAEISLEFRKELGLKSDEQYESYCRKFEESIAKKSTAYQRLEMTPELAAKLVKILKKYQQETEPMLKTLRAAKF